MLLPMTLSMEKILKRDPLTTFFNLLVFCAVLITIMHICIFMHILDLAKGGLLWCADAWARWSGIICPRLPLLGQPSQGFKLAKWNQPLWYWASICSEWKPHGFTDPCMHGIHIFPTGGTHAWITIIIIMWTKDGSSLFAMCSQSWNFHLRTTSTESSI